MEELNLIDYIIIDKNREIVGQYRICPNCGNKIYPELKEEEYFYNCVCQSCNYILFPLFGLYGNKVRHTVVAKIEE